jgi:tyrosinase
MNRRDFVKVGACAAAFARAGRAATVGAPAGVRVSINGLDASAPVVKQYASAVARLKQLPSSDPRNWTNLAAVHNKFCPHSNWWFLPWHRAYIHYFELTCQDVLGDSSFRLPYWDWSRYPRIPGPFLDTHSTLWDGTRSNGGNIDYPSEVVGIDVVQKVVGSGNWINVFSAATKTDQQREDPGAGLLEGTPHNSVHSITEGDMGSFMSPLDPIFWLHHCNVDRIWASWSRILEHKAPADSLWKNHKLAQFYDPASKKQVSPIADDTTNEAKYGASYDQYEAASDQAVLLTQALHDSLASITTEGATTMRRFSMAALQKPQANGVAKFSAAIAPELSPALQRAIKPASNGQRNADLTLIIEGVTPPSAPGIAMRVFLNCKNPSLNTPLNDATYAGTLAFFGDHHGSGHGNGLTFALDVTRTLSKTFAGGYTPATPIDVALVPIDLHKPTIAPAEQISKPKNVRLVGLDAGA